MLVINPFIFQQGLGEGREGRESSLTQDVGDPPLDPFDHPIGLRVTRLDQAMLNVLGTADLVKRMSPRWGALPRGTKPISKFFSVIREDLLDYEEGLLEKPRQERPRNLRRPLRVDFEIDSSGGSINGRKQIAGLCLIGHPRSMFHIDVDKARIIRLKALDRWRGAFLDRKYGFQIRHPMSL